MTPIRPVFASYYGTNGYALNVVHNELTKDLAILSENQKAIAATLDALQQQVQALQTAIQMIQSAVVPSAQVHQYAIRSPLIR